MPVFRSALGAAGFLAGAAAALGQPELGPDLVRPIAVDDALAGRAVSLVLVKDFMKFKNAGGLLPSVEFTRYTPVSDDEQVVLGRWLDAATSGGTALPVDSPSATPDPSGNLIQTLRIRPLPPGQIITVTITTLVARRERPAPTGSYPILKPEDYPADVRPFLASTPMVVVDHPVVKERAATILAKTRDSVEVAKQIVALANARTYLPAGEADPDLPTSAATLKCGGSCCASAVAAAAVFRACGIPAQVTYCSPPSYFHGVVRFYLNGYGWVRMDGTSGSAHYPLVSGENELSLVRIFDTPIRMEQIPIAYAWPYEHNDLDGLYRFRSAGEPCPQVAMYEDESNGLPFFQQPFPHLEPGSWSAVLGTEPADGPWKDWAVLVAASRAAVTAGRTGAFGDVTGPIPVGAYLDRASTWGRPTGK
jgi:hypothetical protein